MFNENKYTMKKAKEQDVSITFRISESTKRKMKDRIIKKSVETNEIYNISLYLRELIEGDYGK